MVKHTPPPTKFGTRTTAQAKPGGNTMAQPMHAPPPTRFGPGGVGQAKAASPAVLPGHAPPPTRFGAKGTAQAKPAAMAERPVHAPPTTRFGRASAQAKPECPADNPALQPPPTAFGLSRTTQLSAASVWTPSRAPLSLAPTSALGTILQPMIMPPRPSPISIPSDPSSGSESEADSEEEEEEEEEEEDNEKDDPPWNPKKRPRPKAPSDKFDAIYKPEDATQVTTVDGKKALSFPCNATKHNKKCTARGNRVHVFRERSRSRSADKKKGSKKKVNKKKQEKQTMVMTSPRGSGMKYKRPPVCHDIPWAKIEDEVNSTKGKGELSENFRQFMCWGGDSNTNLGTGYDLCNSSDGAKLPTTKTQDDVRKYVKEMKEAFIKEHGKDAMYNKK